MKGINDMKSDLSKMMFPRHDDTTMTPAVVAMMAWMEDTSLRKRQTHENIEMYKEKEVSHTG